MGEVREDQKAKIIFHTETEKKELDCNVQNVYSDRISLLLPKGTLNFATFLEEGTEIGVKIFTPSGVRIFNSIILDSPLEPEFVVEYIEDTIQVQRREFSRTNVKTKFIIEKTSGDSIVTYTLDIGGGGVRFFHEGTFLPNQLLNVRLYLPQKMSSLVIQGKILDNPHLPTNEHVLLFTKINENDRDKIIKKCFEIEASLYKKE